MVDNKLGFKTIIAGDRDIPIYYTNRAIANAERLMKKGIIGVLSGFQQGESGVAEVAILLQSGMQEARRVNRVPGRVTLNDAYKILDDLGFSAVAADVFEAVGDVLSKDRSEIDAEFDDLDPEKN